MVRTGFAGNRHPALSGRSQQFNAPGGAYMLTVNFRSGRLRQQDVSRDDHLLARSGPAAQAQHRAPVTFMHHAVADERVILAMIHDRQIEHPGILQRATHELMILHAMAVIGNRHDPGLLQRTDRGHFFAGDAFGNCAGHKNIHLPFATGFLLDQRHGGRIVDRG